VSGLVVSINSLPQIDEYLYASGQPLQKTDVDLLEKYDRLVANDYCRPGCGACLDRCPYGVPVDDIFRYAMYHQNYGRTEDATAKYAALSASHNASRCVSCPAPCEAACPFEIKIRDKLLGFHQVLRA
jgi:predicted aldo/keto reductase-like oxidoreductase